MAAKASYKKPRREIAMREIRRMIIDLGLTNVEIGQRLGIPAKTIERYISDLYKHDNEMLASINSNELLLTRTNVCRDRMDHHRQEILETIAHNPDTSVKDKLAAWNIICELECAELRLLANSAALVVRRSPLPLRRYMLMSMQQQDEKESDQQNEEEQEEEPPRQDPTTKKLIRAAKDDHLVWK